MADEHTRPADVFWLERTEHLELLGDSTRLEILELLLSPRSVARVAEHMGVPRTRLYHHVNLLEEAGMIRVVDTRQVGAATEKVYQVSAYSFQPSPKYLEEALPREQAKAVITSIFAATEADFIRSVEDGTLSFEDRRESRRVHLRRSLLLLDEGRLHEFIAELEGLYEKYDIDPDDLDDLPDDVREIAAVSLVYPSSRRIL